ncbi:hypothetical protein [Tanticharoenia sakaeratensis]|uniref:Uncharacterized protein n=1 Tax=Tanticharoenia sakaeratensis NBRC 103193 TaxID=1231623 RepID=A0A0D6MMH0_9PROT|nr:hypothetical protein [Tanticharoenia sakaeratensis]GAN54646.1 hypothetical protein Tasa_028_013 [Tanticharoenia sakaeratensis NBRC 103193]GBQ16709.1 hypothetical protein AA103193_0077 [Tanticharoenia sakaeratensis NBRC 103193]
MRRLALTLAVLACATTTAARAETRLYANTCYEKESGDIAGYVVTVTDARPHPAVALSWTDGDLVPPHPGTLLTTSRPGHALSFIVAMPRDETHDRFTITFRGHYDHDRLIGTLTGLPWVGRPETVTLKRRTHDEAFDPKDRVDTGYCARTH